MNSYTSLVIGGMLSLTYGAPWAAQQPFSMAAQEERLAPTEILAPLSVARFLPKTELQQPKVDLDEAKRLEQEAARLTKERNYSQAILLLERALEIRQKAEGVKSADIASSLSELGELSYSAGNYDGAIGFMARALAIREKSLAADDPLVAESLTDLASLYVIKGDFITPEPMLKRALLIQEKRSGPNSLEVAATLNSLATLYENRGDRKLAELMFKRSLAIREKELGEQHRLVATSLNNLGRLYMANMDFANAEPLYKRSLRIRETLLGSQSPDLAVPIINLATLFYQQGKFDEAEPQFTRALKLQEAALGAKHPALVNTLNNLAEVHRHKGEFNLAESLYQRALELALQTLGPDHPAVALVLRGQALLEEARGKSRAAVSFLERCNNIRERNLALTLTAGSESQKLLYMGTLAEETDVTLSLHLKTLPTDGPAARLALNTILQRKGRVLDVISNNIETLRRHAGPQDLALLARLASTRAQLAKIILSPPSQQSSGNTKTEVAELEKEIEHLESEISASSIQFRAQSQSVTLERVQQAIPKGAALVEFVIYRPFDVTGRTSAESFGAENYAAYVLGSSGELAWVNLGGRRTITQAVARFRRSLADPSSRTYRRAGRALDELVMRPIRKLISGKRRLFISPDGDLNLIPFGALVDERNKFLVQSYSITYLSSGRDLLRLQVKSPSREGPVVVANPDFNSTEMGSGVSAPTSNKTMQRSVDFRKLRISPLPGTAQEAKALKSIFPVAKIFTGIDATEASVKKVSAPSILHVATHGFFFADRGTIEGTRQLVMGEKTQDDLSVNPLLRSGLVMAGVSGGTSGTGEDGVLTALEVADLDLWGTQLVVLSACDTGLGDVRNGDGVYGLRRALVLAGAESQVMSLWKVSDSATRDLMTGYYSLLKAGAGRTDALKKVQLEMINETRGLGARGRLSHPYYWASFIQSGEWRSL